jgi:hypothetical protein
MQAGRAVSEVARSLEISPKTLANWVRRARAHKPLVKREPAVAPDAAAVELSRLRSENARLRMDNEILKNRPRGSPRPICLETGGAYTEDTPGQWPLAFWRRMSPSKNLAQGKLRTQLWWHFA